jgi:hypothetical protein
LCVWVSTSTSILLQCASRMHCRKKSSQWSPELQW